MSTTTEPSVEFRTFLGLCQYADASLRRSRSTGRRDSTVRRYVDVITEINKFTKDFAVGNEDYKLLIDNLWYFTRQDFNRLMEEQRNERRSC